MVGRSATTVQALEQRTKAPEGSAQAVRYKHFVSLKSHYPFPFITNETVMEISDRNPAKVRFVRSGMDATLYFRLFDGILVKLQSKGVEVANIRNRSPTYYIDGKIMSRQEIASKEILSYTTDYFVTGKVLHRHVPITSKEVLDRMSRERVRKAIMQRNGRFTALTGNDRVISSDELGGSITLSELGLLRAEGKVVHLLRNQTNESV